MKTVGSVLAEERIRKNITLSEAERATKIRAETLQSIEADNFETLPGSTYIKGFIKNYGEFLGLDSANLLALFRRQFDEKKVSPLALLPDLTPKESPKLTLTPGRALGLGIAVLALGFMGYLLAQYNSFASAPGLQVSEPKENLRVNNGTVEVVGRTDRDATLKINGQQVQLTESGAFSVSVTLPDGVNDLTFSAVNKLGRVTTVKRSVTVESTQAAQPLGPTVATSSAQPVVAAAATTSATPASGIHVTIKIGPNAAYIKATVDNQPVSLERIFYPGTTQTFTAQNMITIKTGNAGSTEILVNGVSQGNLGEEAQVVTKTFTKN